MYAGLLRKALRETHAVRNGSCLMVCQQLDELEWDFIQAREESPDLDSLGWTDREFSCLDAILEHKREGHQGERCLRD
jgi:hypothetical protein